MNVDKTVSVIELPPIGSCEGFIFTAKAPWDYGPEDEPPACYKCDIEKKCGQAWKEMACTNPFRVNPVRSKKSQQLPIWMLEAFYEEGSKRAYKMLGGIVNG